MTQNQYTLLFYVNLLCGLFISRYDTGMAAGFMVCSALFLIGGDISKRLQDPK